MCYTLVYLYQLLIISICKLNSVVILFCRFGCWCGDAGGITRSSGHRGDRNRVNEKMFCLAAHWYQLSVVRQFRTTPAITTFLFPPYSLHFIFLLACWLFEKSHHVYPSEGPPLTQDTGVTQNDTLQWPQAGGEVTSAVLGLGRDECLHTAHLAPGFWIYNSKIDIVLW